MARNEPNFDSVGVAGGRELSLGGSRAVSSEEWLTEISEPSCQHGRLSTFCGSRRLTTRTCRKAIDRGLNFLGKRYIKSRRMWCCFMFAERILGYPLEKTFASRR